MGDLLILGRKPVIAAHETAEAEIRLSWHTNNTQGITEAEKTFNEYASKGWLAVGEKSGRISQIFHFDPTLDKITLGPMAVGG